MRSKVIFIALCILNISALIAKESYYYYDGAKIPLQLSDDSVTVYDEQGPCVRGYMVTVTHDKSYTSVEYIIQANENKTVKMSNRFYVQLYDSIADFHKLQRIALETKTAILGQVPNIPDWYELVVYNSSINNSLEMSNYFYETGLFKNVDPGFIFHFTPSTACVTDSYFSSRQWDMTAINACDAWTITSGKANIKIAIIDQGVYQQHAEFISTSFVDSYNCYTNSSPYTQTYGAHGTMCCGMIASDHNNNDIAGMAPECKIMPISHPLSLSSTTAAELASGLSWATTHGADVINCSWGDQGGACYSYLHSSLLESALQNALTNGRKGKGCVVVFASGNYGAQGIDYPAYVFSDILTVGAIDATCQKAYFSAYGNSLDLVAPGVNIYTTTLSGYDSVDGTSLAAPLVAAVAGLILSVNPSLTQKEVADIIESTAQKVGPYSYTINSGRPNGTWHEQMGYGLVDAYAAVMEAKARYPIQGPDYVCDTAKYYLLHPLQQGETVSWSVHNGVVVSPSYSIIGATNQDTVTVVKTTMGTVIRNENTIDLENILPPFPSDTIQKLKAIINGGNNSDTIIKIFRKPINGDVPTITASNNAVIWTSGTSRTFSITNCTSVPDSLLQWEIKTEIYNYLGGTPTISYSYATGRTLTYTPVIPPLKKCRIYITAINSKKECPPNSTTLSYMVNRKKSLSTMVDDDILNINISEDITDATPRLQSPKHVSGEFTLELWHAVYGRLRVKKVSNTHEQIDIRDLPKGVYVLILKDDTNIIAEEKTLIF